MPPTLRTASRLAAGTVAAVVLAAAAGACGTASPTPTATPGGAAGARPVVVAADWALAQVAGAVGGGRVRVVDLSSPGVDPRSGPPSPGVAELPSAAAVIEVGGGWQPVIESAASAAGAPLVTLAGDAAAAAAGPWLDPARVADAGRRLSALLGRADPAHATAYADSARAFTASMGALAADLHVTLSDCPRQTMVTSDGEWTDFATAQGLTDRSLAVAGATAVGSTTVFVETWVQDGPARAAAAVAGARVRSLDTLLAPPATGYPRGATYTALLEQDLGAVASGLSCAAMGQS